VPQSDLRLAHAGLLSLCANDAGLVLLICHHPVACEIAASRHCAGRCRPKPCAAGDSPIEAADWRRPTFALKPENLEMGNFTIFKSRANLNAVAPGSGEQSSAESFYLESLVNADYYIDSGSLTCGNRPSRGPCGGGHN
jgi:hypothetical protein